jgi:hypothetical protein
MKLLEFKQFNNSDEPRSLNKKKVIVVIVLAVLLLFSIIIGIIYKNNQNVRDFMDQYLFFKHIKDSDLASINIEDDKSISTFAFNNYVAVLENNKLKFYNSSGKEAETFDVNINSPIFAAQDNYLVIAEKGQQKVYLFKNKKMVWDKTVEGQISRVNVNENGYVSIVVSGTSYKSVITTYSENGAEVFKTFLSNTVVIDADISKDNKYLSFCEMDLSGTVIESKVKTISIDKAKQDPANAIIYTYQIPVNSLVTNIEYHEKDELICLCDKNIYSLKNGAVNTLTDINESNVTFSGIKLSKSYFKIIEDKFGINNQSSKVEICNTSSKKTHTYTIKGIAKNVYATSGVIAVNLGTEVYFINENGGLIKKLTTSQEVKNVVISNNIAGIIYRNKIEFLSL